MNRKTDRQRYILIDNETNKRERETERDRYRMIQIETERATEQDR
jgi:hypothetical protein